jgi:hypothetical protein
VFQDPDTGATFNAKDKESLISIINNYRTQNRLPEIYNLSAVIDNYLCHLPENCAACEPMKLARSTVAYLKGGIALLKNLWYGEENMVSQEEADRRSYLCSTCPNNVFPDKDAFIQWSDAIALKSVGSRRAAHHAVLGSCAVCSCPLRAKVFYKGDPGLTPEQREEITKSKPDCWQL